MQMQRINVIDRDIVSFRPEWGHASIFAKIYDSRFESDGLFQRQISATFRNLVDNQFSFYDIDKLPDVDHEQATILSLFLSECLLIGYLSQSYNSKNVAVRDGYSINDFLRFSQAENWMAHFNPVTSILMGYIERQVVKHGAFLHLKPSQEKPLREAVMLNVFMGHHIATWEGHK